MRKWVSAFSSIGGNFVCNVSIVLRSLLLMALLFLCFLMSTYSLLFCFELNSTFFSSSSFGQCFLPCSSGWFSTRDDEVQHDQWDSLKLYPLCLLAVSLLLPWRLTNPHHCPPYNWHKCARIGIEYINKYWQLESKIRPFLHSLKCYHRAADWVLLNLISWITHFLLLFNILYLTYILHEYLTNWKSGDGLIM